DSSLAVLASGPPLASTAARVPSSAEVRDATEGIDLAAYFRRHDGIDTLRVAFDRFFGLLVPILTAELVKGVDAPDQPDRVDQDLARALQTKARSLSLLYHLFYSQAFRDRAQGERLFGKDYHEDGLGPAWDAVRAALNGRAQEEDVLRGHVKTLCRWLNRDFYEYVWPITW